MHEREEEEVEKEEEGIGCKEREEVRQGTVIKMCTSAASFYPSQHRLPQSLHQAFLCSHSIPPLHHYLPPSLPPSSSPCPSSPAAAAEERPCPGGCPHSQNCLCQSCGSSPSQLKGNSNIHYITITSSEMALHYQHIIIDCPLLENCSSTSTSLSCDYHMT